MRSLILNVAPVHIREGSRVRVTRRPYVSRAQLRELRQKHGMNVLFARRGDAIDGAQVTDTTSEEQLGGEVEERELAADPRLASLLVERSIVERLVHLGRKILDVGPIHFVSEKDKDDVVRATKSRMPEWLRIRLAYRIHVRVRYVREGPPEVVVIVDTHVRHDIDLPVSEILSEGIDVRGLYVVEDASVEGEPFRRRPLLGRVEAVEGAELVLVDHREGRDRVPAGEAYLEPKDDATARCAERFLGDDAERVMKEIDDYAQRIQGAESRLGRVGNTVAFLARDELRIGPEAWARVGSFFSESSRTFLPVRNASRVIYVFDPRGVKVSDRNAEGLELHNPYSSRTSLNRSPRICVIAEAKNQGSVEQFLYKFMEGIEGTVYARGFRGLFSMAPKQPPFFLARDGSAAAYRRAVHEAIEAGAAPGAAWDLAFVQVRESTRSLRGDDNPYLVTKAMFLGHQLPVQEFRLETVQQPASSLAYSLRNLALATYAKVGGTPWLLKSEPTTSHELVVGLGSAWTGSGRLGERQRLVGITTLFSGDGSYWLHTLSRAVPIEEYQEAVIDSVRKAIDRVRLDRNWSKGDQVRLVFHAFKPFRNIEADAVLSIASSLPDFEVQAAFVHVVGDAPYALFDERSQGDKNGRGRRVPARGPIVELGDRQALVLATGNAEMKRPGMGMPRPLLLELHGKSSFSDLGYLADQVFQFASHSWRGFLPSPMPVTIGYSQQIARLLSRLRDVTSWSPASLYGKIGFTRWFL